MASKIQTIKDIRICLLNELSDIYPEPEIKAFENIIIKTVLKYPRLHALAYPETKITRKKAREIIMICQELKKEKPLQYILGETSFYNLTIKVNSNTLIPRPETEEMTDLIIKENKSFTGSILDAGTGSGCIAITLAVNLPGSTVTGFDISQAAITLAQENALLNKAVVRFFTADMLNPELSLFTKTDIIVSNPPYVTLSEKKILAGNILNYEPHHALFVPDNDPLKFYRAIINLASEILNKNGRLYFEINESMGEMLSDLLIRSKYREVRVINDLNGKARIIKAIKND